MSEVYEGVGSTVTFGSTGVSFSIEQISGGGGWSKEVIDVTTLSNVAAKTKVLGKLKEHEDFSITVLMDPTKVHNSSFSANELITLAFPSAGSLAIWGAVSGVAPGDLVVGDKPTTELTITVTNRNGSGVETVPAFSA